MRNRTDEEIEAEHKRAPASWRRKGDGEALEGGGDYTLKPGDTCWITVGNASVYLKHGDDGVSVTLYPLHHEDEDSVTETWATWGEFDDPDRDPPKALLHDYGCYVWVVDGVLFSVDPTDFTKYGPEAAIEVTAPESQGFLDRVNEALGTDFWLHQFDGR